MMGLPPPPEEGPKDLLMVVVVSVLLAGAGIAVLFGIGILLPLCGCPGQTPLGVTLSMSTGTGTCIAGNGSTPMDCAYSFRIEVLSPPGGAPTLTAPDLVFRLQTANHTLINATFTLRLVTPTGCGLGEWDQAGTQWAAASATAECGAAYAHSIPIESGQLLLLKPGPPGGLPFSNPGDQLSAEATGGGFSGTVSAGLA
ncbi:MAG: hypothetical protein L3K01_00100 [Thermoplasmata archaeon]|nr:hypothetical protein [Thermoplasmata archaeon]